MRRLYTAVATAGLAAAGMLFMATPAHAETSKFSRVVCNSSKCLQASVGMENGYVRGEGYYAGRAVAAELTVVLYQCSGTGSRCGVIGANRTDVVSGGWMYGSPKPVSFGHTYKACVSSSPISNVCTPLLA